MKILKGDGTNIPADRNCSMISNFLNSWEKIILSINNKEIFTSTSFGFVSYLTSVLLQPKEEHRRRDDADRFLMDESAVNVIASNTG